MQKRKRKPSRGELHGNSNPRTSVSRLSNRTFDIINITLLSIITLVILYPIYFTVIASVSDPYAVVKGKVIFWFKDFTLDPYKNVFANKEIWTGYANSIANTMIVVVYSLCITISAAFTLSRKDLRGKKFLTAFFILVMYFGGGMVPYYLLIKNLHLMNTRWALILPAGFSVYNMIIAKASIQTNLPEELFDAAKIDGCSIFGIYFKIVLPLSKAIIAVIALYVAVASWSSWFDAMLFINDKKLYPLQYVLRGILIQNQELKIMDTGSLNGEMIQSMMKRKYMAEGMKYSVIFISSLPMLIAYPFVQKYFTKGVMIGSVKE